MRKVLLILVMLMSVAMLAAAVVEPELAVTVSDSGSSDTANVKVVLPLDEETFGATVVVGFSGTEVASASDITPPGTDGVMTLTKKADENKGELTRGLHAYWQSNSNTANFTLKIYPSEPLSNGNETIDWSIKVNNGESSSGYGSENATPITTNVATDLIDSVPVTIETADYTGKPLAEYAANLYLEVFIPE